MEEILKLLNEHQREAVEQTEGPVLVLAGAGSGKTRVLTTRVAKIVKDGVKPSYILAVTFTNKAANEIKDRLARICGEEAHNIWAGTFHSICVRMLKEYGQEIGISKNFTIYDEYAQSQCVKQAVENLKYDPQKYNAKKVIYLISDAKEKMISCEEYDSVYSEKDSKQIGKIYGEYVRLCKENMALDFDDLINYGVKLLKESTKAREHYQKKFKYVHVDEFQDINYSQYLLVSTLAKPQNNIFCVGDDDQSIYGWRGADISIILNFRKDFKNSRIIKLEQNYRSTKNILGAAYEVVKKNENRNEKTIWTDNDQGETIEVFEAQDNNHEASLVAKSIEEKVESGEFSYSDIAILYRTNSLSRSFENYFNTYTKIPYDIYGGLKFYERKEIKDILSYLTVIFNPLDNFSLKRIINNPPRGIGETTVEKLDLFALENGLSLFQALENADQIEGIRKSTKDSINAFAKLINHFRQEAEIFSVDQIIKTVLDYSGYKNMLLADKTMESSQRLDNIQELINVAVNFMQNSEDNGLGSFLQSVSLQSDTDDIKNDGGKVLLMTVHASKGLEFPVVYVVGLEDGVFPHERSLGNSAEMEEERRLMYVAMTRAKKHLILSYCNLRQINGKWDRKFRSPFIDDIPSVYFTDKESEKDTGETLEDIKAKLNIKKTVSQTYSPGNKLRHPLYGKCLVVNCQGKGDEEIVTVMFDDKRLGMKRFKVAKSRFERL